MKDQAIGLMSRVFTNGLGDQDSITGRVLPKTQKMVLDAALLNHQHYKVRFKGKVEQSGHPRLRLPTTTITLVQIKNHKVYYFYKCHFDQVVKIGIP